MIKDYREIETIYESKYSRIYKAQKVNASTMEADDLMYAIKEYKGYSKDNSQLIQEKKSSQMIENVSKISVVVPVLESLNGEYLVMQYKKNGYFLSQIIDHYVKNNSLLHMGDFFTLVESLLRSVDILHNCYNGFSDKKGYLHMDIHPGNIFVENITDIMDISNDESIITKFVDLQNAILMDQNGLAKRMEHDYHYCDNYSAPEVLNYNNYYFKESTDLYSVVYVINELYKITDHKYHSIEKLVESVISIGLNGSSYYRYQRAKDLAKSFKYAADMLMAFNENDYIEIADKTYYMNVPLDVLLIDAREQSKKMSLNTYDQSLDRLSKRLLNDRPNQKKCAFIFDYLKALADYSGRQIYDTKLVYTGISCYNNVARTKDAVELAKGFFKQKKNGDYSIIDYSKIINRVSENFYDLGDIDMAVKLQRENLDLLKGIYEEISRICNNEGFSLERDELVQSYAKAHSALGRYLYVASSDGVDKDAIIHLEKALELFGNRKWDRYITINHLLSIAIDCSDKTICEKYIGEYFEEFSPDITDIESFYEAFLDIKNIDYWKENKDYNLLIALKILNAFCYELINEDNLPRFICVMGSIATSLEGRENASYPINLVYKYIGIILYRLKGNLVDDDVVFAMEKACECDDLVIIKPNQQINILMIMSYQVKWLLNEMKGDTNSNDKLYRLFEKHSGDKKNGLIKYHEKAQKTRSLSRILKLT